MAQLTKADRGGEAIERFKRWYCSTGHWVYNGRADAVRTWTTRGIDTLPDAPANAAALLAGWVAGGA